MSGIASVLDVLTLLTTLWRVTRLVAPPGSCKYGDSTGQRRAEIREPVNFEVYLANRAKNEVKGPCAHSQRGLPMVVGT